MRFKGQPPGSCQSTSSKWKDIPMSSANVFRSAVEARNFEAMMAQFAEKAVLHSPVTFAPFEGRAAIQQLLTILLGIFQIKQPRRRVHRME